MKPSKSSSMRSRTEPGIASALAFYTSEKHGAMSRAPSPAELPNIARNFSRSCASLRNIKSLGAVPIRQCSSELSSDRFTFIFQEPLFVVKANVDFRQASSLNKPCARTSSSLRKEEIAGSYRSRMPSGVFHLLEIAWDVLNISVRSCWNGR